jgi:hypothetical protein
MSRQDSADLLASFVNHGTFYVHDHKYYSLPLPGGGFENEGLAEYYKYPMESLYDETVYGGAGDCEDMAILVAAIARSFGFNEVAIITITKAGAEGHAIAGIKDASFIQPPEQPGAYFYAPNGYYACETTDGWGPLWVGNVKFPLGDPPGWTKSVYPVKR